MGRKGTVYFFTGLSGAGKTTIGGLFYRHMKAKRNDVVLFDGDQMRQAMGHNGYSTEARKRGALQMFHWCRVLADQGIDAVCCNIAMYDEVRHWNRDNIVNYKEVYIRVKWETLLRRDQKGLYSSGTKEVVGVDLPYDEPKHPDIIIQNDGDETPEEIVARIERQFFGEASEDTEKNTAENEKA